MAEQHTGDVAHLSLVLPRPEERSHVLVGSRLLERFPALLTEYVRAHRYVIITDATVARLHGEPLADSLRSAGLAVDLLRFPAGEASKTPGTWATLVERMATIGAGRDSCVVSVGGGVTGDLAGFVAASFGRGIPFVQVPTSLLAMIDASIGGKTGLDLEGGKNLVGAFHQPRLVVVDPLALATLPPADRLDGLAEAVKHGAIADAAHFDWIEANRRAIVANEPAAMERLILDSIRIKARFVAEDAHERGVRSVLNFGHTVAHALERLSDYALPHGAAVAIGMVVEARAGEAVGTTEAGTAERLRTVLKRLDLPIAPPTGTAARAVLDAATTDKKAVAGEPRYVLLRRIGEAARGPDGGWTHPVPDPVLESALDVPRARKT